MSGDDRIALLKSAARKCPALGGYIGKARCEELRLAGNTWCKACKSRPETAEEPQENKENAMKEKCSCCGSDARRIAHKTLGLCTTCKNYHAQKRIASTGTRWVTSEDGISDLLTIGLVSSDSFLGILRGHESEPAADLGESPSSLEEPQRDDGSECETPLQTRAPDSVPPAPIYNDGGKNVTPMSGKAETSPTTRIDEDSASLVLVGLEPDLLAAIDRRAYQSYRDRASEVCAALRKHYGLIRVYDRSKPRVATQPEEVDHAV